MKKREVINLLLNLRKTVKDFAYFKNGRGEIVGGFYSNTEERLRGPRVEEIELINKFTVLKEIDRYLEFLDTNKKLK